MLIVIEPYKETTGQVDEVKISAKCPYCGKIRSYFYSYLPNDFVGKCRNNKCKKKFHITITRR